MSDRRQWFIPVQSYGAIEFISGQVPHQQGQLLAQGRLGEDVSLEQGRECARQCAQNLLDAIVEAHGSLDAVAQVLKLTVFIASASTFTEQPDVANAASRLFVDALGPRGEHARSAIGVAALPLGAPVEVEAIVALRQESAG